MSCDLFLGVPFNWVSQATLQMMLAHVAGFELGEMIWYGTDVHVYTNHFDQMNQLLGKPYIDHEPRLKIVNKVDSIDDFTIDDFVMEDYHPHDVIKADVAV